MLLLPEFPFLSELFTNIILPKSLSVFTALLVGLSLFTILLLKLPLLNDMKLLSFNFFEQFCRVFSSGKKYPSLFIYLNLMEFVLIFFIAFLSVFFGLSSLEITSMNIIEYSFMKKKLRG